MKKGFKWQLAGILLLVWPQLAYAGELDSIFASLAYTIKAILGGVVVLVCLVLLVVTMVRPETLPAADSSPSLVKDASILGRLSGARMGRVALLAAPGYAAWLYVAAYNSAEFEAGQYLAFYAPLVLFTLATLLLLWLLKRPSAAAGLGLTALAIPLFLFGSTREWNQGGSLRRFRQKDDDAYYRNQEAFSRLPDSLRNGIYTYVERMPTFAGGPDSMRQAIRQQLRYPPQALANQVQGSVVVGCAIGERGEVLAAVLVRGIGAGCDEEALRVMRRLRFQPATQNDRPVRVYITTTVRFELPYSANPTAVGPP